MIAKDFHQIAGKSFAIMVQASHPIGISGHPVAMSGAGAPRHDGYFMIRALGRSVPSW
jgi:hypothetical protein